MPTGRTARPARRPGTPWHRSRHRPSCTSATRLPDAARSRASSRPHLLLAEREAVQRLGRAGARAGRDSRGSRPSPAHRPAGPAPPACASRPRRARGPRSRAGPAAGRPGPDRSARARVRGRRSRARTWSWRPPARPQARPPPAPRPRRRHGSRSPRTPPPTDWRAGPASASSSAAENSRSGTPSAVRQRDHRGLARLQLDRGEAGDRGPRQAVAGKRGPTSSRTSSAVVPRSQPTPSARTLGWITRCCSEPDLAPVGQRDP